jgi:hypothetical protein
MHSHPFRSSRAAIFAVVFIAIVPVTRVSAAPPPCPLAQDALVAQAVGSPVTGGIMTDFISDNPLDTGPDKTVCWWDAQSGSTVTLTRQTNAFGPAGATGPAQLAQSLFRIPDEAKAELELLQTQGVTDIQLPTYQMTSASGIGDAAVWVFQNDPALNVPSGGFLVQRGADAIVVGIIGEAESTSRSQASALAQAVLATLAP